MELTLSSSNFFPPVRLLSNCCNFFFLDGRIAKKDRRLNCITRGKYSLQYNALHGEAPPDSGTIFKAKQNTTTIFVPKQKGNRIFQNKYPHASVDKYLSAVTFETA